jgi:anti-sigma factor RsiW
VIDHATEQQLQTFLDGELAPPEQRELESHLHECVQCRDALEEQRKLFRLIEGIPESALARDLAAHVIEGLQPAARWLPRLALGELLAAVSIAAALTFGLGRATVELNLNAAMVRLTGGVEATAADLSNRISEAVGQAPVLNPSDLSLELPSAGMAWTVVVVALGLWAVGNGLLLRWVRREG